MANIKKVNKSDFEVFAFITGYYGIINSKSRVIVFGGDSANEDDYNKDFIESVFAKWNGELVSYDNEFYFIEL